MNKPRLMQGNQACAEGMIAAGVRFFAGYPITPSTEVAEILAEELPKLGGKFIQMEDEIASMCKLWMKYLKATVWIIRIRPIISRQMIPTPKSVLT